MRGALSRALSLALSRPVAAARGSWNAVGVRRKEIWDFDSEAAPSGGGGYRFYGALEVAAAGFFLEVRRLNLDGRPASVLNVSF